MLQFREWVYIYTKGPLGVYALPHHTKNNKLLKVKHKLYVNIHTPMTYINYLLPCPALCYVMQVLDITSVIYATSYKLAYVNYTCLCPKLYLTRCA
jgi:hypothetical protein